MTNCKDCQFFKAKEYQKNHGECRRYPFTEVERRKGVLHPVWPEVEVAPRDWCGEFAEAGE